MAPLIFCAAGFSKPADATIDALVEFIDFSPSLTVCPHYRYFQKK